MKINRFRPLSRRRFLASTTFAAAGAYLMPRLLFAEDTSAVVIIRNAAATAKINVQKLRMRPMIMTSNDPSSATRRTRGVDCNRDAHAGFAAAHG